MMIVHMIGNAHIDPVWLWRWPEGFSEMLSTCRTMVKLLKESDDVIFTKGEAVMYEWIEKTDPDLFKEISELVSLRRWNIVNGWWVQPDCNIPSGESFVRQGLYGKKFFKEHFGIEVKVGYNVDSFGHAATLPQILKKSGFEYYVFMRPGPQEKQLPSIFKWKSPDGSEVVTFRVSRNYETRRDKGDLSIQIKTALDNTPPNVGSTMCFYGVGDHGGGPTKKDIEYVTTHKHFSETVELKFSSPDRYFEEIKSKDLPVIEDELQYHSIGSYSVNSKVKIMNRKAENGLLDAEKFATIATSLGMKYPYETLENAWKSLLFNQFHDLLGGTAIREAYEDAYNELGGVIHAAEKIKYLSIQFISSKINTEMDGIPFAVFNPSAFEREEYVEFEPWLNWEKWENKIIVDSDGKEVEYQRIMPTELMKNTYRMLFKAKVPPLGYTVYFLRDGKRKIENRHNLFENNFYHIEAERLGGFYDKSNIRWLYPFYGTPLIIEDKTDTWSHGINSYPRKGEKMKKMKMSKFKIIEAGNIKSTVEIEFTHKRSRIVELLQVYKNDPLMRAHFFVDWHEPYKVLKFSYLLPHDTNLFAEIPYGILKRPSNGQEYPMQRALFLENNGAGLTIANNGKYAYDFLENELRITILRNPPYAWHMPHEMRKKNLYFTDEGIQEFDLWFTGHIKKITGLKYAQSLNEPLSILTLPKHDGSLPPRFSFGRLEGEASLEVLKMSEKGDKIVRLWETEGKNGEFEISLFGKKEKVCISKNEIKTLRLGNEFRETNLVEEDNALSWN